MTNTPETASSTPGTRVRAYAEHLGGTVVRFHYPCGHTSTKDYSKGPVVKRMGTLGVKMMASWWSQAKGGVTANCPKGCTWPGWRPAGR